MSAPEASTTRQRGSKTSTDPEVLNPTSLGTTSNKDVRRSKPNVSPPFYNISMNRFLTYLTLTLFAIGAFYTWRFTVWASNAGGYWNLITGKRAAQSLNPEGAVAGMGSDEIFKSAASAASAAGSAASNVGANSAVKGRGGKGKSAAAPKGDIQSHIFTLATALGVTPHDLTAAIRPLIDPSVPNPIEAAAKEIEMLKLQLQTAGASTAQAQAAAAAAPVAEPEPSAGLLGIVSEVLLD